jgi:hypothetical protein
MPMRMVVRPDFCSDGDAIFFFMGDECWHRAEA